MRSRRRLLCCLVLFQIGFTLVSCQGASSTAATSPSTSASTPIPSSTASQTTQTPALPTIQPSTMVLNFVNNMRYQWYPTKAGSLCEAGAAGCVGGLECLMHRLKEKNGAAKVPLISAGNALDDPTGKTDYFTALKFEPAVKALNSLKDVGFKAALLGQEMFRYGGSQALKLVKNVETSFTACNLNSTVSVDGKTFSPYVDIPKNVTEFACDIRVIGFATNRTKLLNPENIKVFEEFDSVKRFLDANKRLNRLTVVVGEGTKELAKQISTITDVDLVLLSGSNVTDGEPLEKVTEGSRTKYLVYKEITGAFLKLSVSLTGDCSISSVAAETVQYDNLDASSCKADSPLAKEAIKLGFDRYKSYLEEFTLKTLAPVSTSDCKSNECILGSLAADAVASAMAVQSTDAPLESRVVLFPSNVFNQNVTLKEAVTQKNLLTLLQEDQVFYNVSMTGAQLKQLLENMLATDNVNFPQLSGLHLYRNLEGGKNSRVNLVQILGKNLIFTTIQDRSSYRVAIPLNALHRNGIKLDNYRYVVTDVFLSKALFSHLKTQNPEAKFLLPPPLGDRVTYVLPLTQSRCENLIALTVCYTFLSIITICGLLLLGYKIYSDRTAVHYVR